ncbi:MAG: hypothetical protein AAF993_02505 [Pseudomonadota bacterium]
MESLVGNNGGRTFDQEIRDTKAAMNLLEELVPKVFSDSGPAVLARLDNALLNIAVNRILAVEGPQRTAAILMRLADAMVSEQLPTADHPIDLTSLNG